MCQTVMMSLMEMLSRTGPSIDPWGTLVVTGLQLDFVPLITTLWAWPFRQFSNPPHCLHVQPVHQQLLYEDVMGDCVKESQNIRGQKGLLWIIWSSLPAEAGSPTAGCTGPCPDGI